MDGCSATAEALRKWNGVVREDSKKRPSIEGCSPVQYGNSMNASGEPYLPISSLFGSHITLPGGSWSSVSRIAWYSGQASLLS